MKEERDREERGNGIKREERGRRGVEGGIREKIKKMEIGYAGRTDGLDD